MDGSGGKIHSFWAMYSLRMSVWIVPPSDLGRDALALGHAHVLGQHDGRRGVDGHRRRDAVERDPGEQVLHVGQRVDGDALAPDLAQRPGVVGVVSHQRRHVEGRREAGLAMVEQVAEAAVRLLGRAEPRELAHRPELAAVHRLVDPARVGIAAGVAQVAVVVDVRVGRPVHRLVGNARDARALGLRGRLGGAGAAGRAHGAATDPPGRQSTSARPSSFATRARMKSRSESRFR